MKGLLSNVQGTYAKYSHALENNKKMQKAVKKWKQERHRLNNALKNAKRAKTESKVAHWKEINKRYSRIHALEEKLQSIKWPKQCLLFLLVIVFDENLNTATTRIWAQLEALILQRWIKGQELRVTTLTSLWDEL